MTLKASFITVRYYTNTDPYHYTIDNRPLTDLKTCLDFLADTMDAGFTTGALTVTGNITQGTTTLGGSITSLSPGATWQVVPDSASGANGVTYFTSFFLGGTGPHRFKTGTVEQFRITHTASAVNYLQATGGTTGNDVGLSSQGSDANVNMDYVAKGTGSHIFFSNGGGAGATQFKVLHAASSVNFLTVSGAAAGNAPFILAGGNDSNVSMRIATSGAGIVQFEAPGGTAQVTISSIAGATRTLQLAGSNGGNPQISTSGGNIDIGGTASNQTKLNVVGGVSVQDATITYLLNLSTAIGISSINAFSSTGQAISVLTTPSGGAATERLNISSTGVSTFKKSVGFSDITITYSAAMTPDASTGNFQTISATNATAFAINAPTNPVQGEFLTFTIRNTSGGALGVATWNAVFKMAAWTQPANANSRTIKFKYDGTNWIEHSRTPADIPN